jgi:two-component system, NtrC family, response regulator HydG
MTCRVLVVDDEAPLLMTLVANLELEGFEVYEAKNAEEALVRLEERPFDLVLSDIRMPGMSGVELCHVIRKTHHDLPIILMTAFSVESLVYDAVNEGALLVLPKPFAIDQLIRILSSVILRPVVLVVDDTPEFAQTMTAALREVGLPARAVHDGKSALEAFTARDVSVCVVDMVMPELTGDAVIAKLRSLDPNVVVIAISGHDVDSMFQKIAEHADSFLRKPIDPQQLLHAIASARLRRARHFE